MTSRDRRGREEGNWEPIPGWQLVAELDRMPDAGYEWDVLGVFRNTATGRLACYGDSGCSCFGPYENLAGDTDFVPLTSLRDLDCVERGSATAASWATFLGEVHRALPKRARR